MKKGFCPKQGKSLNFYPIFRFSCKPMGTISSARKHIFEKKYCKSVAKTVVQKVPSPERRINTGLFGTSKPRGTIPTLFRDYHLSYFTSISSYFCTVLRWFFAVLFPLSSLVLQNMLQIW